MPWTKTKVERFFSPPPLPGVKGLIDVYLRGFVADFSLLNLSKEMQFNHKEIRFYRLEFLEPFLFFLVLQNKLNIAKISCIFQSFNFNLHSFIHAFFIYFFIRSLLHSFNSSFVYFFIHSFNSSFIHSFLHSFIHFFIHSFIHSFLHHSFIYSFFRRIRTVIQPRPTLGR